MLTIFLVGEVSSGKSSFINSLVGQYVANTALLRETINQRTYALTNNTTIKQTFDYTKQLKSSHKKADELRRTKNYSKELNGEHPNINKLVSDNNYRCTYFKEKINIVDFPGINDSTDNNNIFIKKISENIEECDLIIFISDAQKTFLHKSELSHYKYFERLIEKERANGHYIEMICVINKFDNINDTELNSVCEKIPINRDKIFRYSSHKMFINTIKKNKLICYLPNAYMKREFINNVIKNSNYSVSYSIKKKLNDINLISYIDINKSNAYEKEFVFCSSSDEENSSDDEDNDYINEGDWDDLIERINEYRKNLDENRIKVLKDYIEFSFSNKKNMGDKKIFIILKNVAKKLQKYKLEDNNYIDEIIIHYLGKLLNYGKNILSTYILIDRSRLENKNKYLGYIWDRVKFSGSITSFVLLDKRRTYVDLNDAIKILGNKRIWEDIIVSYFDGLKRKSYCVEVFKKECEYSCSKIIRNLLYNSFSDLEMLIELSLTRISELRLMKECNSIPFEKIESIDKETCMNLRYFILNGGNDDVLKEKLFQKCKYVKKLNKKIERFKRDYKY